MGQTYGKRERERQREVLLGARDTDYGSGYKAGP